MNALLLVVEAVVCVLTILAVQQMDKERLLGVISISFNYKAGWFS